MMKAQSDAEIAKILKGSLQSTCRGLNVFSNSLKTAGFMEAAPKYRQLEIVLIQQRLWCKNKKNEEFAPLWKEIANTAHQIYKSIGPISEIMGQLEVIDSFTENKTQTPQEKEALKVLSTPQPMSLNKLSKLLNKEKRTIKDEMHALEKKGLIKTLGKGNGTSYCVTRNV
jgi:hypothetical protein